VLDDFVLVQAGKDDQFSNLADEFLFDSSKDWVIADFNDRREPETGESLVIPLQPLHRGGLTPGGYQTVPILRYDKFSQVKTESDAVTRAAFEAQMAYLRENAYRVITLQQFLKFVDFKDEIPPNAVVITIDGESQSVMEVALPILRNYGYPATLFLKPGLVGEKNTISWTDVHLLAGTGIDIQCRIATRPPEKKLDDPQRFDRYVKELDDEFRNSKALFRRKLGNACAFVAYPVGDANRVVIAFARKYGLEAGLRSNGSSAPFFADRYFIGRTSVSGVDDLAAFIKHLDTFTEMALE
jgi:peptidoglycan/xylan/chitin deacetylase (PgdA/CDA1 family)